MRVFTLVGILTLTSSVSAEPIKNTAEEQSLRNFGCIEGRLLEECKAKLISLHWRCEESQGGGSNPTTMMWCSKVLNTGIFKNSPLTYIEVDSYGSGKISAILYKY